jgi:hypothetical protein
MPATTATVPVPRPGIPDGYRRAGRTLIAFATATAPLAVFTGALLNPAIGGSAQANLAANATPSVANEIHLAAFVVASFLLPLNALGLAWLALPGAPRLACLGGLLGLLGWVPFAALAAQDDLTARMAHTTGYQRLADLWQGFTTDTVMTTYLLTYAAAHLVAYTLLGGGLLRTRALPSWVGWCVILTNPLQVAAFAVPPLTRYLLAVAGLALTAGCLAAGWSLHRHHPEIRPQWTEPSTVDR